MTGEADSSAAVGGTYTLLIELAEPAEVTFGAAGRRSLDDGWYAYTGSALGSGGFARVDRHRRLAEGDSGVRHWHVDHLLGHPGAALVDAVRSPGLDAECEVARSIAGALASVPGVGATDCACPSHLATAPGRAALGETVRRSHEAARASP